MPSAAARPPRADELPSDCSMAEVVMRELPAAYDVLPPDILVGFITVNRYEKARRETTLAAIKAQLDWVASMARSPYALEDCITSTPSRRAEFEKLYMAGPIGTDAQNRIVVLESIGPIPPGPFVKAFTCEEMIRHVIFNRQAAFSTARVLSHSRGVNMRQALVVIDLKGLSLGHLSSAFLGYAKNYINTLLDIFPEAAVAFYCINSPAIMRVAWRLCQPWLDEESISKTKILGGPSAYEPLLKSFGVKTDAPIAELRPSWEAPMRALAADADRVASARKPFLTPDEATIIASGLAVREAPKPSEAVKPSEAAKPLAASVPPDFVPEPSESDDSPADADGTSPADVRARLLPLPASSAAVSASVPEAVHERSAGGIPGSAKPDAERSVHCCSSNGSSTNSSRGSGVVSAAAGGVVGAAAAAAACRSRGLSELGLCTVAIGVLCAYFVWLSESTMLDALGM